VAPVRSPGRLERFPRVARAYLAGFGTSGSLLIGLALMFIVASTLVAFHGWPHVGAQPSPGEVVVSPQPAAATGSAVARRLVAVPAAGIPAAAPPSGAIAADAGGGARGIATPGAPGSIGRPVSTSRPVAAQVAAGSPAAPVPAPVTVPLPAPAPVQQITQTAKQGLQQATAALGKVVEDTGGKAGTVVQQTTNTAAGAVQTVSPPAASVVKTTGSGTATLVGGVTKAASGLLSGLGH